ncbi:hypothetical protein ACFY30_21390 [Streptomyces sp. NPDC000345]|uniref:hypothetical protein n=1 Tax=Streptomyces sp. NPDC000345 TaxID=3364537 RepID=UPI00367630D8
MTRGGAHTAARAAARLLGLALLAGVSATACGDPAGHGTARSPSPSPATTAPEELCTRLVAHWSREALDGGTYGDYQSMGLSNGQYEILRSVVDAARAEKKRHGADAADELIDRETRAGCTEWYRSGGPGEGPWQ